MFSIEQDYFLLIFLSFSIRLTIKSLLCFVFTFLFFFPVVLLKNVKYSFTT